MNYWIIYQNDKLIVMLVIIPKKILIDNLDKILNLMKIVLRNPMKR